MFDFLQSRKVYPFYIGIYNTTSGEVFKLDSAADHKPQDNTIHVVNYIPPFLQPRLEATKNRLKAIHMTYFYGFMADLSKCSNLNEYLLEKMSSKSRTKIRSYVRKLETCFPISYRIYFGDIPKHHYEYLFTKFEGFLQSRFLQRGDSHELLPHWNEIQEKSYGMIRNKTASLFVIYNGEEPIDICLNYHTGRIMHNGVRSYDIAYSKFRLGYIDILKQLDWCFDNGIELFDLGIGDMSYKRLWCNVIYDFEHQILYRNGNVWIKLVAIGVAGFFQTKEFLKKKGVHKFYRKIRKSFAKQDGPKEKNHEKKIKLLPEGFKPAKKEMALLNLSDETHLLLRKAIYDFQYSYLENSNETKVYQSIEDDKIYLIKGRNKEQWLKMI